MSNAEGRFGAGRFPRTGTAPKAVRGAHRGSYGRRSWRQEGHGELPALPGLEQVGPRKPPAGREPLLVRVGNPNLTGPNPNRLVQTRRPPGGRGKHAIESSRPPWTATSGRAESSRHSRDASGRPSWIRRGKGLDRPRAEGICRGTWVPPGSPSGFERRMAGRGRGAYQGLNLPNRRPNGVLQILRHTAGDQNQAH